MSGRETVGVAIARLAGEFARAGIDNPRLDARVLIGRALGISAGETALHSDRALDDEAARRLKGWAERRGAREPIARIIGEREFWGLTFELVPETLEPRPDSETVVSAVLEASALAQPRVLDLGTGTGCLLIAVLKERPDAIGLGIDISPGAVACATRNAGRAGVAARAEFKVSSWLDGVAGKFDVVLANPPYLSMADMAAREPEVAFDPVVALAAGVDGCDAYRAILAQLRSHVTDDAVIAFEIGATQADTVSDLARVHGFKIRALRSDLAGRPRCLLIAP